MPSVWIQERFTATPPTGFTTNFDTGAFWQSILGGTSEGKWGADTLIYVWNAPSYPPPTPLFDTKPFTHLYYAATKNTTVGATSGIYLASYTMTFTPGAPNTYGTVSHNP